MLLSFLGLISPGQMPKVESVNVFMTLDIRESDGLIHQQAKLNLFRFWSSGFVVQEAQRISKQVCGLSVSFCSSCLQHYVLCNLP